MAEDITSRGDIDENKNNSVHEVLLEDVSKELTESEKTELDINRPNNPWQTRYFSKLGFGSLRASIFNMCATAIGGGILSLPYVMKLSGIVLGSLLSVGGAFCCIWSLYMLLEAARVTGSKNYVQVCQRLGGKALGIVLEVAMIIYIFGVIILYQIIYAGLDEDDVNALLPRALQISLVAIFILYPLSIMKDMSSLSYAALASIVTIAFTLAVVIVEMPSYFNKNYNHDKMKYFYVDRGLYDSFAFTFFAFCCQATFFNIYAELARPNVRRVHKMTKGGTLLNFSFYYLMAIFGYLSNFDDTPEVICDRPALHGGIDWAMSVGKLGVYITISIHVPINYASLRRSLFNTIYSPDEPITNPRNLIITAVTLTFTSCVAIFFPDIRSVISIWGGLGSTTIAYIVPTTLYLLSSKLPTFHWKKVGSLILCGVLCIFGIGSACCTFVRVAFPDLAQS